MSLLFFDGFDNPATMPKPEWDSVQAWANQTGRDGSSNGASAIATSAAAKTLTLPTASLTLFVGCAIKPLVVGAFTTAQANPVLGFRVGALDTLSLTWDATGHLQLRSGGPAGTVLATGAFAWTVTVFNQIQVKVVNSTTAASVQVYVNGSVTADIDYTGASAGGTTGAITALRFGNATSATSIAWDDLYVCDDVDATATQGRPNNGLLGDLKVVTLIPTAVGTTQWTPSTAVANWTTVDENPPNTTDYVAAATAGLRDTYDTTDFAANATAVYGMRVGAYALKTDTGAASIKPGVLESGGTFDAPSTLAPSTTYAGMWTSVITRKGDNTLWTPADVNAAQVGVESA